MVAVEEMTGESVNDAVYSRNLTIEERFNTKIYYEAPGIVYTDTSSMIKKAVTAGDSNAFRLIFLVVMPAVCIAVSVVSGIAVFRLTKSSAVVERIKVE